MLTFPCYVYLWIIFNTIIHSNARCLQTINPGDSILSLMRNAETNNCSIHLTAGTHTISSGWFSFQFIGTENDPLNIYGDLPIGTTKLYRTTIDQNMLDLSGEYFNLFNLELEGGDKGLRLNYKVYRSSFYDLKIHGTNANGLTANSIGPYTYNHFHDIEIYDTNGHGEGMYLGCNNDACDFSYNVIENCYIHDTNSSSGNIQGDGIDLKGGTNNNILRNNIISNTIGPGILTYDSYGRGRNIIENNIIYNPGAQGIQITSGQIVRNNIVYTINTSPFYSHASNQLKLGTTPNNISIYGNTFISTMNAASGCVEGRGWLSDNAKTIIFSNNLIICGTNTVPKRAIFFNPFSPNITFVNNAYYGASTSMNGYSFNYDTHIQILNAINESVVNFEDLNFYPKQNSVLINNGNSVFSNDKDIDCVSRGKLMTTIGAYEYIENAINSRFCLKGILYGNITNKKCTCNVGSVCPMCQGWNTQNPTENPAINPSLNPTEYPSNNPWPISIQPTIAPIESHETDSVKICCFECIVFCGLMMLYSLM